MIHSSDIRDALSDLIKIKAGLPLKVFFNHVNKSKDSYAWVQLRPAKTDEGFGYLQRHIRVIISIVLAPDKNGEVKHTDLYDMVDALDEATCNSIPILDRHITIYDTNANIFDDILNYDFMLDFTDCIDALPPAAGADFMRELDLLVNDYETWSVHDD